MFNFYSQPPLTFTGHYEEFPTRSVQQWNDFVPQPEDADPNFLAALEKVSEEKFYRGRDTLVGASAATRESYAKLFQELQMNFSIVCDIGAYDLVPNGKEMAVNENNFLDYVFRTQAFYRDFEARQVAFCTLEDDPVGLRPLVPTRVPPENSYTGKFDQLRTDAPGDFLVPGTGWLAPGPFDFAKPLPFPVFPACPPPSPGASYTAVFLFCRIGECVAGKCVGWALQSDTVAFRFQAAPGGWMPVKNCVTAYRELARRQRESSANAQDPHSANTPSGTHVRVMRELREGPQQPSMVPTPPRQISSSCPPNTAAVPVPPAFGTPSGLDRTAARERAEKIESERMRLEGKAKPLTDRERAFFSPMHESGGLLAPMQAINL